LAAQRDPVTSVEKAIILLGENLIMNSALRSCMAGVYDHPLKGYEGEKMALWKHSLATAIASRELCPYSRSKLDPGTVYTAGIMHDLGKVVISEYLEGQAEVILERIDNTEVSDYLAGEREQIRTDHCEAGYLLAKRWKFPEPLTSAIYYHHSPELAKSRWRDLVYLVHMGDILAMMIGAVSGSDGMHYGLDKKAGEYIQVPDSEIESIMIRVDLEYRKIMSVLMGPENQPSETDQDK